YYRGTNTSKKIEGSGLGLAIAHDIIKVHGGTITAHSKSGEGLSIEMAL
ncbi:MAG: ATP-binding protein, partial [Cellulosilyticaceae bacterium]